MATLGRHPGRSGSEYGLTSVLDFAPGELPARFEGTVADLDPGRLLDAGRRVAVLLNEVGERPTTSGPPCPRRWPGTSPPTLSKCGNEF